MTSFPLAMESPNGSTVKSEGVTTMDVSTVSERTRPPSPDQATGELKDREMNVSQNASEKSDAKRDTCSIN